MTDITLKDGREIAFDLEAITLDEYRALFEPGQTIEDQDAVITKVTGLAADEFKKLSLRESKRIWREFLKVASSPLADPN